MAGRQGRKRLARLAIEPIEPRLLLSATVTSAAAQALQKDLVHFQDVLGALETFGQLANALPLVNASGGSAPNLARHPVRHLRPVRRHRHQGFRQRGNGNFRSNATADSTALLDSLQDRVRQARSERGLRRLCRQLARPAPRHHVRHQGEPDQGFQPDARRRRWRRHLVPGDAEGHARFRLRVQVPHDAATRRAGAVGHVRRAGGHHRRRGQGDAADRARPRPRHPEARRRQRHHHRLLRLREGRFRRPHERRPHSQLADHPFRRQLVPRHSRHHHADRQRARQH